MYAGRRIRDGETDPAISIPRTRPRTEFLGLGSYCSFFVLELRLPICLETNRVSLWITTRTARPVLQEVCSYAMGIRTAFCKADQDQLASFLAANPGDLNGNAIYKEFAQTHTNHTWQSWRHHYISNSMLINAIIRRIRRLEKEAASKKNQPPSDGHTLPNDNHREPNEIHKLQQESAAKKNQPPTGGHTPPDDSDKESRESSTEIVIKRSPMTRKGKEKAAHYLLDTDSDSDCPGTESNPADTPQDFVVHRIPTDHHNHSKNYDHVTDLVSSHQLGKIRSNPSVKLITMSPDEEKKLWQFVSTYPEGDIRLSLTLYESYHLQAPKFSAEQYRTYYLARQNRICRKRPASREPEGMTRPKVNRLNPLPADEARSGLHRTDSLDRSEGRRTLVLSGREDEVPKQSADDVTLDLDTLSVSTGSSDDLELEYILTCPDYHKVARNMNTSEEFLRPLLKLQEDVFRPLDFEILDPVVHQSRPVNQESTRESRLAGQETQKSLPVLEDPGKQPHSAAQEPAQQASRPAAKEPASRPVVQQKASRPAVQEKESRPAAKEPASRPAPKEPASRPVVQQKASRPVVQEKESRTVAQAPESRPAVQQKASRSVVQEKQSRPVAQAPESRPVEQQRESRPVKQEGASRPVAKERTSLPVTQAPESRPVDQVRKSRPTVQGGASRPAEQKRASRPAVQEGASRLAVQEGASRPVVQEPKQQKPQPVTQEPKDRPGEQKRGSRQQVVQRRTSRAVNQEPRQQIPKRVIQEPEGSAVSTPAESSTLTSGKTSRRSSFNPPQPPKSVQEAVDLLCVFLEDFGELYTPPEAAQLLHQCGDWAVMFEVATLKKLEQELKEASKGPNGQDENEENAVDQEYLLRIQKLVWTPEEDDLVLLTPPPTDPESQVKLKQLLEKKGPQAIENRKAFLRSTM
ncbi:hypothetical protein PGTUg99_036803 [Puccinia graminis f. sp. tritici]|uniref:DNA-binding protein RAP1 n=1 Tax=Puccinia graminis f. sp. tritici TaxID=56615 RepID=A0A5B0S5Y8_PUCGR|nr:hypothetical protein PGTUg99_036803 [Puccinia graminis f. sp. tritici]